ncbi:FMN-binding protein [Brucepastera parasyntrophica]|uniref:FMN-binding protein n=1 Tax=Brucepastera parasyntrophica TaxID=2880008 RepID=UPI00210AFBA3|nr:FMN-binding protein [Brucepastera parasyntrophica]ULQ60780.1 FMN-binding protein [Brucepastera parasyntrophica]
MKNMVKLALILTVFASVACVALALVYNATAPIIEGAKTREEFAVFQEFFPNATGFEDVKNNIESGSSSISFDTAYVAKEQDSVIGMVISATGRTYATTTVLLAVDMNRKIKTLKINTSDTPGIGSKAAESPFKDHFPGKSVDDEFKPGTDIQAISGATISSRTISSLIKTASYQAADYLASHYGGLSGSGGSAPISADLTPMSVTDALAELFPGADAEPLPARSITNTVERSIVLTDAWLVKKDGSVIGAAVQGRGQTYHASTILVGVAMDRTLAGIRINATTDTRNYGYEMLNPNFYLQFAGKSVDDDFTANSAKIGSDIDALSGATSSSMGVANIVKIAGYEAANFLAEQYGGKTAPSGAGNFILNTIPDEQ